MNFCHIWISLIQICHCNHPQRFKNVRNGFFRKSSWPGLGLPRPKAIVVIPKNQPLPKYLREKKRVKVRSTTGHYATKKRPVKITMYLGLDIIIKLKFTTNFDRCEILTVLNYFD